MNTQSKQETITVIQEKGEEEEDEKHICGITGGKINLCGCEEKFDLEDTCMIGNTSFCIRCYEKNIEEDEEEEE